MSNSFLSVFGPAGGGADATKLPLTGGTLTGALINSTNGAASAPVVSLTGTTFTGGTATTTKPTLVVEPTGTTSTGWSTSGTLIGANAATGFTGSLMELHTNGVAQFKVVGNARVTAASWELDAGYLSGYVSNSLAMARTTSQRTMILDSGNSNINLSAFGAYCFTASASGSDVSISGDLFLRRSAAASLQLGTSAASGWVSQTFAAAGGRIGSDTNNSPTNTLTIAGSISTGTGTGGNLRLGVYGTNGTSGTAIGTLNTVLTVVAARKVINIAGIPTSSAGLSSGDVYSNAGILTIVA